MDVSEKTYVGYGRDAHCVYFSALPRLDSPVMSEDGEEGRPYRVLHYAQI